jgi:O-antigen/teichoic acid export membrane protein
MTARVRQWGERFFKLAVNPPAAGTERERRSRGVVRGTIAAFAARAIGSLAGFITVPLTVRYLGPERYGAWMTISSLLLFLGFSDFGLASSLTNALGKAFGKDDREQARRYVTTTFVTLCLVALVVVVAGIIFSGPIAKVVFPIANESLLKQEIAPALKAALAIFALNFPLLVTNRVLAAYQENAIANLWIMASSIASLTGILIVIAAHGGLVALVIGSAGAGLLVSGISSVWLYGWHKPWLAPTKSAADFEFVRELFSSGWKFFIMNVGWMLNSQTDNIIIAHYLGAAAVTPYAVTFRLFAYATLLQTLLLPSLWPAYTEAAARQDYDWIHGVYRKSLQFSLLVAVIILTVLALFGRQIIRIWAGAPAVPTPSLIIWMALCHLLLAYLFVPSCFLQATGHLNRLTIYGTVTALLNVVLSIFFVQQFGISGVIAATVIAYTVASYIPTLFETRRVLGMFRAAKQPAPSVG